MHLRYKWSALSVDLHDPKVRIQLREDGTTFPYQLFLGDFQTVAICYPSITAIPKLCKASSPIVQFQRLLSLLKDGCLPDFQVATCLNEMQIDISFMRYLEPLRILAAAQTIYSPLSGALVDLNVLSSLTSPEWWESQNPIYLFRGPVLEYLRAAFSCITLFASGTLDLDPSQF